MKALPSQAVPEVFLFFVSREVLCRHVQCSCRKMNRCVSLMPVYFRCVVVLFCSSVRLMLLRFLLRARALTHSLSLSLSLSLSHTHTHTHTHTQWDTRAGTGNAGKTGVAQGGAGADVRGRRCIRRRRCIDASGCTCLKGIGACCCCCRKCSKRWVLSAREDSCGAWACDTGA